MVKSQTIINLIEQLAPKKLAEDWDNVGLQVGSPQASVQKAAVCLDLTEAVLEQAIQEKIDMIITHHPLIFKPLKRISFTTPLGLRIAKLIQNNITVYSAHTNLDIAEGGINDILVDKLGLEKVEVLAPTKEEKLYKLVVFVPDGFQNAVQEALVQGGAGWIGKYSHCSFQTKGQGTFKPLEGTNPFLGTIGKVEETVEYRLETIVPEKSLKKAINLMLKVHPYEEVAYDVYLLNNEGKKYGLGRVGYLSEDTSLQNFVQNLKGILGIEHLRVVGDLNQPLRKIALCGGSGSSLISIAAFKGAQVLLTADIKYHEARDAEDLGLALIDAGHDFTEQIIVPILVNYLQKELKEKVEIIGLGLSDQPIFKTI